MTSASFAFDNSLKIYHQHPIWQEKSEWLCTVIWKNRLAMYVLNTHTKHADNRHIRTCILNDPVVFYTEPWTLHPLTGAVASSTTPELYSWPKFIFGQEWPFSLDFTCFSVLLTFHSIQGCMVFMTRLFLDKRQNPHESGLLIVIWVLGLVWWLGFVI